MAAKNPTITGIDHVAVTVTNIEASVEWYQRVFGLERAPDRFPHHGSEQSGYAVVLSDPSGAFAIALHHHDANRGDQFDETRTGLDHLAFSVPDRATLDTWAGWLDSLGVPHSGVTDITEPMAYSVLVFRDPDNFQLELSAG